MALEVQDNPFTSILMVEAADPEALASDADPSAGQRRLVVGADHLLYLLDNSGVKHSVAGSGLTDPMTTRGDIIIRNASNVAARLALGAVGQVPLSDGTDLAYGFATGSRWTRGTSMPGSPATGQRITRTDLALDFEYNGTRWLCTCPHQLPIATQHALLTVSATNSHRAASPRAITATIWLETLDVDIFVATTNDGTRYWTVGLSGVGSPVSTQSLAPDTTLRLSATLNAVMTISTSFGFQVDYTKVSTPGAAYPLANISFRYIGT
jgi:hypothetical protein